MFIQRYPQQLLDDDWKFYKDVKPKTNFLRFQLVLLNKNEESCKPLNRDVPISVELLFENGNPSPTKNALNIQGYNNKEYKINNNGNVIIPLRIEEPSIKHENQCYKLKFKANSMRITQNLDIGHVESKPFLVRTKINKYRIKGKTKKSIDTNKSNATTVNKSFVMFLYFKSVVIYIDKYIVKI